MIDFKDIVHEYSPMLYWHIRRIVIVHEDAQDVLQEALVKAYRRLWLLRDEKALKTWLYRIATNEALRLLSKRRTQENLSEVLENTLSENAYVDLSSEAEIKLQRALLTLTPTQRTVFNLKYYDEMDYQEIAAIAKALRLR